MMLTIHQSYLLEVLNQVRRIRVDQAKRLLYLSYRSTGEQVERDLRQLRYGGKIRIDGTTVYLPGSRKNDRILDAIDTVLALSGNSQPKLVAGKPPCLLSFFIPSIPDSPIFRVFDVAPGEEEIARMNVAKALSVHCTPILLLYSPEQAGLLQFDGPVLRAAYQRRHTVLAGQKIASHP